MLTLLLIFWPLLASLVFFGLKPEEARKWALTASIVEFAISLVMVILFEASESAQFVVNYTWIESLGINFHVGIDGISLLLVLLTTFLTPLIIQSK